ncbi:MAG: META domain-containing protein [Actinomycetota bacterium]
MRRCVVVLSVLLLASACGGDDDAGDLFGLDEVSTTDSASAAADEPAPDPEPSAEGVDRSDELIGTWNVTFYALPDGGGRTNVIDGQAPVQLTFFDDGTIAYHTGCNAGGTTYSTAGLYVVPESALDDTPEGQAIDFLQGQQEEQGCEGFLGEQDRDLPANLRQAERFRLDGDRLILSAEFFLLEAERA